MERFSFLFFLFFFLFSSIWVMRKLNSFTISWLHHPLLLFILLFCLVFMFFLFAKFSTTRITVAFDT